MIKLHIGHHSTLALLTLTLIALGACNKRPDASQLVINELMASNHTCLLSKKGKSPDWIEIKNTSKESVNLKGYSLVLVKDSTSTDSTARQQWDFPERVVKPGELIIVFASKKKNKNKGGDNKDDAENDNKESNKKEKKNNEPKLRADFKLPSKGATLQLAYDNEVLSQVTYGELEDDQCYRRLNNGSYETSYEATPGFDNNEQGYEKYCTSMEQQRQGPLRLWELHTRGNKEGQAWVELKNISAEPVNLNEYCLSTAAKDSSQLTLPSVTLQPGAIYLVKGDQEKLKLKGSKPVILTKDGKFMDGACAAQAPMGTSMGRVEGKDGFFFFPSPTPGEENTTPHFRRTGSEPTFASKPGLYPSKKKWLLS